MDIMPMQPLHLKPCPFCGGQAVMMKRTLGVRGTDSYDWWHSVGCTSCRAGVGYDDNRFREKEDALKAWNNRHNDKSFDDILAGLGLARIGDGI